MRAFYLIEPLIKKVRRIIINVVKSTNELFVLKLRFDDEKTLGIIIKIAKGLFTPPVR